MVTCDEASHEGRTVKVRSFRGPSPWVPEKPAKVDADGTVTGRAFAPGSNQRLIGNEPMRDGAQTDPTEDPRDRYPLVCSLCGLNVTVRRENLDPVLDRLYEHGVGSIELSHLAVILSN